MRYLALTCGMPFCGKSTWIKDNKLQDYTLSLKAFKLHAQGPMMDSSGTIRMLNEQEKTAYQMMFIALESRMQRGEFIVIEDGHTNKSYISHYRQLANVYNYEVIVIDFRDVPLETIKQRLDSMSGMKDNSDTYFHYTYEELHEIYENLKNFDITIKCTITKPEEFMNLIATPPVNLNGYKAIHHIGDIQGSFWVLKKYIEKIKDDEFYIFLGDYIDRGKQNYEVVRFLMKYMGHKNVCLLQGNHEKWLWEWANGREVESREFRLNTQIELEQKKLSPNEVKRFFKALKPFFFYKYHDKKVICTHGGVTNIVDNWNLLSANQCIQGVGGYLNTNVSAKAFSDNTSSQHYQFFGHRNKSELPINVYDRNFIMESKVEFGGFLRAVVLDQNGFRDASIKNKFFVNKAEKEEKEGLQRFIDGLAKSNRGILTKRDNLLFVEYNREPSDILDSAYCFYPCVVDLSNWQVAIRGLRLDSDLSRKYSLLDFDKYASELEYPIKVFRKTTGTQVVVSYNNGKIYFFRDSKVIHPIENLASKLHGNKMANIIKKPSFSMLFTMQSKRSFVLHDILANSIKDSYIGNIPKIAKDLGLNYCAEIEPIENKDALKDFISRLNKHNLEISSKNQNEIYLQDFYGSDGFDIFSGFIVRGSNNKFMPLSYYYDNEVKVLDSFLHMWHAKGYLSKLQWINNPLRERFYTWVREYTKNHPQWDKKDFDIIKNGFLSTVLSG